MPRYAKICQDMPGYAKICQDSIGCVHLLAASVPSQVSMRWPGRTPGMDGGSWNCAPGVLLWPPHGQWITPRDRGSVRYILAEKISAKMQDETLRSNKSCAGIES